jgi:hypothetical protein
VIRSKVKTIKAGAKRSLASVAYQGVYATARNIALKRELRYTNLSVFVIRKNTDATIKDELRYIAQTNIALF